MKNDSSQLPITSWFHGHFPSLTYLYQTNSFRDICYCPREEKQTPNFKFCAFKLNAQNNIVLKCLFLSFHGIVDSRSNTQYKEFPQENTNTKAPISRFKTNQAVGNRCNSLVLWSKENAE